MFTLHQINAYEEQGHLIMDMCCGDDGAVIGDFTIENLSKASGEELDKVIDRKPTTSKWWNSVFSVLNVFLGEGWCKVDLFSNYE